ncbi:MAG: metal-dependent hydrolase [Acidobacteriota bacterium]
MPTVFSHAAVGFIAAKGATEATAPNTRIVIATMALAALPDADALFFGVIPYNHPFGHRGFTHSLFFAAIVGLFAAVLFLKAGWAPENSLGVLALIFGVTIASHGFFDAMTDGGLGVAFFAPFTNHRYFFPWRPIPVAPLSLEGLLNARGWQVIRAEAGLFWTFTLAAVIWDRRTVWRMILAGACALVGIFMWVLEG